MSSANSAAADVEAHVARMLVAEKENEALGDQVCEDEFARSFTLKTLRPGGRRVIYCPPLARWFRWDDSRYAPDTTLVIYDAIRGSIREDMVAKIETAPDSEEKKRAKRAAIAALNARTVAGVERLLRADREHAVAADVLDRHPMLANTTRGTVDLESGELNEARQDDLLTKRTGVAPDLRTKHCPTWERFIDDVTNGDEDLALYLQRVAGYCLTGLITEHVFFFMYGTGANGKSTFLLILMYILGDYAIGAPAETFMESHNDRHPTEQARLQGARLVVAQEIDDGARWRLALIKSITGGDSITARVMRGDFFTFQPQCKIILAGNHRPGLRNVDEAIRRRIHLVPFEVTIPPERRDPQLLEKLKEEAEGILAWMVEGCLLWQQGGLQPPERVKAATHDYLEAEDSFGAWLDERTCRESAANTGSAELYHDYAKWTERGGEHPVSNKRFSKALEDRGLERKRDNRGARFSGIRLRREIDGELL